jgi:hypothetical protein
MEDQTVYIILAVAVTAILAAAGSMLGWSGAVP